MCGKCGCSEESEILHEGNHEHLKKDHLISIEKNILEKNKAIGAANRLWLYREEILALNILSSPGSGKTTLLVKTIQALKSILPLAVIEGDQQTKIDAQKIEEAGALAWQINTGKGCHLDAHQISNAVVQMQIPKKSILFIENIGNLVCPALFDLGEHFRVVVLSVTEGDDKPLKYPDMFYKADLMIINKVDLLPYVDFNIEKCIDFAKSINPTMEVIQVSAANGNNLENWYQWLITKKQRKSIFPWKEFV